MHTKNAANFALKVHFIPRSVLQTTIITLRVTPVLTFSVKRNLCPVLKIGNKTEDPIVPENAHLKPDFGAFSNHKMTLTLNTHTPLLIL